MGKIFDRIVKNVKLTLESLGVISVEITKVVSYWLLIWLDTKKIYKMFKKYVEDFKHLIWK